MEGEKGRPIREPVSTTEPNWEERMKEKSHNKLMQRNTTPPNWETLHHML